MTRRHRAPTPLWTTEFVIWCVAMVLLSGAGGVLLAVIASHMQWG